jgi:CDP-glycerol glycerophosphotransferase (TagB/SpsB family)
MGGEGRSDTFLIATSDFTREIFAQAFGMPHDRIIVTGQARTDRMLTADREDIWRRAFPNAPLPRRIFLWLPTFRNTSFVGGRRDGASFGNIFNCSDFSESAFNAKLKVNDAVCLVKPHPMATRRDQADLSNLRFIDENWLQAHGLSLYQLTGIADCLISDISSIIADFMLLDRPIVLLFEDIEVYEDSRGFSFNPITNYLPANVARDFNEFLAELEPVLAGADPYADRRAQLKRLFFDHFDAGAAGRILDCAMGHGR